MIRRLASLTLRISIVIGSREAFTAPVISRIELRANRPITRPVARSLRPTVSIRAFIIDIIIGEPVKPVGTCAATGRATRRRIVVPFILP
jgi:hypothetical protein